MIDRAEHRRGDSRWLAQAWERSQVFAVWGGRISALSSRLSGVGGQLSAVGESTGVRGERLFLGVDEAGVPYFAVMTEVEDMLGLRELLESDASPVERSLAISAVALANWHESHQFHPATGKPTTAVQGGWVRTTEDGELMWPRTSPAVLALIHDGVSGEGGQCLLSRNVARAENFRSVTAGFVEPGENLEETVARESFEELGVDVRDIHYYASESWPFNDQLMVAFTAVADPNQPLVLDPNEILAAEWYSRAELRESDLVLPSTISISRKMIDDWLAEL